MATRCSLPEGAQLHFYRAAGRLGRPREGPLLQPFVEHPESRPVPGQDLQTIAAAIAKPEQMPRDRIQRHVLPHERRQPIDRTAEIGRPGDQVDPDGRRERQHAKGATTARISSADAPDRTVGARHSAAKPALDKRPQRHQAQIRETPRSDQNGIT